MTEPTAWARGYPVSEPYPPSWHYFQSPAHLRVICALMGVAWEVGPDKPMSIAEVGCGTGYTAAMLAAGNPQAQVLGLDYNPAHIAEARSLADAAGLTNLRYEEADLAELSDADLDRLPEFDLVTVHGVWSWVADPVREGVLRLLRRRLKPGGVALLTYNALPGAAGSLGLARLARGALLAAGSSVDGVSAVSDLVQRLIKADPMHLPASHWRRLFTGENKGARPGYVLHEFLTEHWRPAFFADVAAAMGTARCEYVGSATIDENFPQMTLTPAQRELWDEAPDDASRELIKDLCVQRAFRRDVYVRGLRRVPRDPVVDALWVAAAVHKEGEVAMVAQAGVAKLPQPLIDAVRAALREGPKTIGALRALPGCGTMTPSELAAMLIGSDSAVPLWRRPGEGADWDDAIATARRFNTVAADRLAPFGVGAGSLGLATPALAGGLAASAFELAVAKRAAAWQLEAAQDAAGYLPEPDEIVRRLLPPGPGPGADIVDSLEQRVAELLSERLDVWRELGVV
jgi:SAM-dependent methyltransferase